MIHKKEEISVAGTKGPKKFMKSLLSAERGWKPGKHVKTAAKHMMKGEK